jgi:hypothetical protein
MLFTLLLFIAILRFYDFKDISGVGGDLNIEYRLVQRILADLRSAV